MPLISARHSVLAYRLGVAVVLAVFGVACLHHIDALYLWGHDGYNGSAFAQAAKNSMRFGIVQQAQYYTELTPPPLSEIYTNHPLMIHFHLIGMFSVFGEHEWPARLVPALYSFFALVMLFFVTRRFFGRAVALLAITIYTLTPLHTIYANMVAHEQGSIFWCLCFVSLYLRWLQTHRVRTLLGCLGAVTIATQFDWPGYYIAFFVALHAAGIGLVRRPPAGRRWWRREWTFVSLFSVVVLANFAAYFGWVWVLRGGLDKMVGAFTYRSVAPSDYEAVLFDRSVDLYGGLLMALLALWIVWTLYRAARRQLTLGDLIPIVFLIAQIIHSTVFQMAGRIHAYWTYHAGVTVAVGGAALIWAVWRHLSAWVDRRGGTDWARYLSRAALALPLVVMLGYQTGYAVQQHRWGYDTGRAAYAGRAYSDEYYDHQWARALASRYGREDVHYIIHRSAKRRVHWIYYLDAPRTQRRAMHVRAQEKTATDKAWVLLADLERVDPQELVALAALTRAHKTSMWERRFVAIEVNKPAAGAIDAWVATPEPRPWWWRWLSNFRHPPISWTPDTNVEAVQHALEPRDVHGEGYLAGGSGGAPATRDCPAGSYLQRATVRTGAKPFVLSLQLQCASMEGFMQAGGGKGSTDLPTDLPRIGVASEGAGQVIECGRNRLPVGIAGRAGTLVDAVSFVCARAGATNEGSGGPRRLTLGRHSNSRSVGGRGGQDFVRMCRPPEVLVGLTGRSGAAVDALGIRCGTFDELSADGLRAPR